MTAIKIIQECESLGVTVTKNADRLKVTGPHEAIDRMRPVLQESKSEIIAFLEAESELRRLVHDIAVIHNFSAEDEAEALRNALADWRDALTCFRALKRESAR